MMGGDFAPLEAAKGIRLYLTEHSGDITLFLFGHEPQLTPLLSQENIPAEKIKIVHAPQVIGMHEHPT